MFTTLGNFSAVYFTLAAVLFILILFEKYFIRLEDKIRANKSKKNNSRSHISSNGNVHKNKSTSVKKCKNAATVRRIPNNAA